MQRRTWLAGVFMMMSGCVDPAVADGTFSAGVGTAAAEGDDDGGLADESSTGGPVTTGADGPSALDVASDSDVSVCPCAAGNDGIYLMSDSSQLWSFDPASGSFTQLGVLACAPPTGYFQSMAVDRQGIATLAYQVLGGDGAWGLSMRTYRVALDDLSSCEEVQLPLPDDRVPYGMGYVGGGTSDGCDDLFVFDHDAGIEPSADTGGRIARIDHAGGEYAVVGTLAYEQAQVSGSGAGRLYAFAGDSDSAQFLELAVADAAVLESRELPGHNGQNGLAFAFWGGDAWLFSDSGVDDGSIVTRVDLDGDDGGGSSIAVAATPVRILGAGVSTCAPYVPTG